MRETGEDLRDVTIIRLPDRPRISALIIWMVDHNAIGRVLKARLVFSEKCTPPPRVSRGIWVIESETGCGKYVRVVQKL